MKVVLAQDNPARFGRGRLFHLSPGNDTCCLKNAFSATSSDLLPARSVSVPGLREVVHRLV